MDKTFSVNEIYAKTPRGDKLWRVVLYVKSYYSQKKLTELIDLLLCLPLAELKFNINT